MKVMLKVKPYTGRFCSRKKANEMRDFIESLPVPDRTDLKKEAEEFRTLVLTRRKTSGAKASLRQKL